MPKWSEITKSESFKTLTPEDRAKVKATFFANHIDPLIDKDPALKAAGRDRVFQDWMATPDDTGEGMVASMVSAAGRGVASVVPNTIGGVGYLLGSEGMVQTANEIEQSINAALPVNPIFEDTWGVKIAGAVGQAAGTMATGYAGGAVGSAVRGVNMVNKAASAAVLGTGGLAGAREGGQIAEQQGMTGLEAAASIAIGGAKEILTEKMLPSGLAAELGITQVFKGALKAPITAGASIASESVEGMAAQGISNAATIALSPEGVKVPGLFEGMGEAGVLEAAGGATFAAGNAITGALMSAPETPELKYDALGKLVRSPIETQPINVEHPNGKTYHRNEFGAWGEFREGAEVPFVALDPTDAAESGLITDLDNQVRRQPKITPAEQPVEVKPIPVPSEEVNMQPEVLSRAQSKMVATPDYTPDTTTPVPVFRTPDGKIELADEADALRVLAAKMTAQPLQVVPAVLPTEDVGTAGATDENPRGKNPPPPAAPTPEPATLAARFKPGNQVVQKSTGKTGFVRRVGDTLVARTAEGTEFTVEPQDAEMGQDLPSTTGVVPAVKAGDEIIAGPTHAAAMQSLAGEQPVGQPVAVEGGATAERGFIISGQFYNMVDAKTKLDSMGIELPKAQGRDWITEEDVAGEKLLTPAEMTAIKQQNMDRLARLGVDNTPGTRTWATDQITVAMYNLARDPSQPKTIRLIADILSRMNFPDIIINIKDMPKGKYAGQYDPKGEGIGEIKINVAVNGLDGMQSDLTLLHEVLHHVTTWKVANPANEFERNQVRNLDRLRQRAMAYAKSRATGNANDPSTKFAYEMSNVDEFIAGLFTRVDFQQFLAGIPEEFTPSLVGRARSLLQNIFNSIAKLVTGGDVPHGSVLDEAFGSALDLMGSGAAYQITSMPGVLNAYAGEKAIGNLPEERRQFMRDSLETAKAMAAAGKTSEEIRAVTGWFPGKYDGKMRWEVPDEGALLKDSWRNAETISDVIDHPALFAAYPSVSEVKFRLLKSSDSFAGSFDPFGNLISLHPDHLNKLGTILHEIQHWIQHKEGFPSGSSPGMFSSMLGEDGSENLYYLEQEYRHISRSDYDSDAEFLADKKAAEDKIKIALNVLKAGSGVTAARRTAGEIEARDVQARQNLTPEQRAATTPYSSENIAPEDAIVLFSTPGVLNAPADDYRAAALERNEKFLSRNADGSLQGLKDKWQAVNSVTQNRTIDGEPVPGLVYEPRRDEAMEAAVMNVLDDLQLSGASARDVLLIITSGIQPGSNVPLTTAERAIFTRWLWRSGRFIEFDLTEQQLIKGMQSIASEFGYIGREWKNFLDPITKVKQEADDTTNTAFTNETGGVASEEFAKLKHELEKAEGILKYLLRKGIRGQRKEDVDRAEKALESFRTMLARDGAKATADAFFRGGPQRTSNTGPLVEGADVVKHELAKLLNEALDMMGIERAKAKTPDEYQRIAVALGLDDVRSDKLKEIDKLIRERITSMIEGAEHSDAQDFADMMLDQWEEVSSHMTNSAVSGATARRVFKQVMKELGTTISDLISLAPKGRTTAINNITDIVIERVRNAGSTVDLSNLRDVMRSTGEMLVDGEIARREKAAELRNDQQAIAEATIAQFEKKFSGIPNLDTKQKTGIRKLVDDAIHAREIMPDFVERAMALGVDELTAKTLGDMTLENGRRKAKEREDRKAKAERVRRAKTIARFINGLQPKEKKASKKRMGKFIRTLMKADELGVLTQQVFLDSFAGAFNLNLLTSAVVTTLRDKWRDLTALNENGTPKYRGMVRETLQRQFMEAINSVSPGARLSNVIFDQYTASALASAGSIVNQFSGLFRVIFGVEAFSKSYARGDVLGTATEWWTQVKDMFESLPLVFTGITGESLGISMPELKTTFKPGEQKLMLTGDGQKFRIQRADGSVYEMGDTTRKLLRLKELWTWRAIRGAEALSGTVDAKAGMRDILMRHYQQQGDSPSVARAKAHKDLVSSPEERAIAEQQAQREREEGLISKTDKAQFNLRVQQIINERIEDRFGLDLISRVEYLTAASQFKTVPTGLFGYIIYRGFSKIAESKNSLARASRFFLLFGRFLGHTVDTMMSYIPVLNIATRVSKDSTSQRTRNAIEYYGSTDVYNKRQMGKQAAGVSFLLMNGMLMALAEALADDDDEPFYQVFGTTALNRDQKEALMLTGKWKEGVVRIFGVDIAYTQIPELAPLLNMLGNASDYAKFGQTLYPDKGGKMLAVGDAAFVGFKDVMFSPIKRSTYRQWLTALDSAMNGRKSDALANLLTQPVGTALRLPVVVDIDKVLREAEGTKDAEGFVQNLARRIPFVHVGETMVNAYGEELPGLGVISMFPPDSEASPEVVKAASLNVETGTTRVKPRDPEIEGRELTDDERTEYVKLAGRYYVESLLRNEQSIRRAYENGGKEAAQKIISNISTKANKRARAELKLD